MSALREQQQAQTRAWIKAKELLGEQTGELEYLRGGYHRACVRLVAGEVDEAELEEREAELAAVEVRVRRIAAAVEELKPPPRIGAA